MSKLPSYSLFIQKALDLGASEAKIIKSKSIITAAWVRLRCQFGSSGYNTSLCCPPYSPTPEETRKVIDCYTKAILIHVKKLGNITKIISQLEREIFLSGYYKAFGFGSGPCTICKDCNKLACKYPEKARPSLEACGIDVYATVRSNGYPIEVVKDYSSDQNFYGIVLIE
jgi:predicted metal-binding protein